MLCEEKVKYVGQEDLLSLCECMKIIEHKYREHDVLMILLINLWGADIDHSIRTVSSKKKNRCDRATER